MAVLTFVFENVPHFIGTVVLLAIVCTTIESVAAHIASAFRRK